MNFSSYIKSNFLKFISRNKVRPLLLTSSPKFLILMNQKIGDMIVCSPILREIKIAFPNSNLQVIASQTNKDIALVNPYIDNVHIYKNRWHRLLPLLLQFRRVNFDVAIELEAKIVTRVILMLKVIKPNCILSVTKVVGRYGLAPQDVSPYDYYTDSKLKHQRDTCLDILRLLNIKCNSKKYDVFYLEKNKKKSLSFLSSFDSSKIIVGLNISGSSLEKRICDDDVKKIILGLNSMSNDILIILLHKPEDRKWTNRLITDDISSFVFPSYPTDSVLDLAALVDSVDLIISPDTSLVHMACAFNKPLVGIYRRDMISFEAWHPKSRCNHVIFSQDFDSLKSIDVNNIVSKTSELISTYVKKDL